MTFLLTLAVFVLIIIVLSINSKMERESMERYFDSVKTMSLEELIAANDAAENEYNEWHQAWARKKDGQAELRKKGLAAEKLKAVRSEIASRFPDVITDKKKAKEKAYSVATWEQERQMRELEKKLQRQYRVMGASGIVGGQRLEKTHSSVLNGLAASQVGGPVAAGIVYTATEERNAAVRLSNISKMAQNKTWENMAEGADKTELQLKELYEEIINEHDPNVIVHYYGIEYI